MIFRELSSSSWSISPSWNLEKLIFASLSLSAIFFSKANFAEEWTLETSQLERFSSWEFHRNVGQLIGVLLLHKLPVIGLQLAIWQVQASDYVRRVLQMHHCTLLRTQQFEIRAADLVVAVFGVSQVIVFMSAVTVSHSNEPIAWKNKLPRLAVDISTVKTANE